MKGDAYGIDLIKLTAYEKYKTRAHHHAWFHILSLATIVVLDPCSVEAQSYQTSETNHYTINTAHRYCVHN